MRPFASPTLAPPPPSLDPLVLVQIRVVIIQIFPTHESVRDWYQFAVKCMEGRDEKIIR